MKYYVLGSSDSKLIKQYRDKYLIALRGYLRQIAQDAPDTLLSCEQVDRLLQMDHNDFLLCGDISACIIYIRNFGVTQSAESLRILSEQIGSFISGQRSQVTAFQGDIIAGTQIRLTLSDDNPYNRFSAHPDHNKTGGRIGWGERSQLQWQDLYQSTFALLKNIDIGIYDELSMMIQKIIPLGTSRGLHNSSSYKECIGHLYMGYTIDTACPQMHILEALIHESSHNKLNLLMHFDPIILSDLAENYYSPYRPDARHIHGCFLGLHAFAPTIYICLKAYKEGTLLLGSGDIEQDHWLEKFILYTLKNKICFKVIQKHAKLTDMGHEILDEIETVLQMTDQMMHDMHISPALLQQARKDIEQHFQSVNRQYPNLKY